jgi:hypothetical protein
MPDTHTPAHTQISQDITDAVRETAVLVDLSMSTWSGERTDRAIGDKVKEDAGAVGNTGRYLKNLLAGCDTKLKEVRAAYAVARTTHYTLTLPWVSDPSAQRAVGPRLLPNALFDRYIREMGRLQRAANASRDEFLAVYPALVQQAQSNLGDLANADEYPATEEIAAAFRLRFDFQPIPDTGAFRGLSEAMLGRLGEALERRQQAAIQGAQNAMWGRVREGVEHLVDRLAEPDTRFKETSIEGVRELITLLPGFNCVDDPRVTEITEDIRVMLDGITAKDIRQDTRVREDVVTKARAINERLRSWGL